MTTSQSQEEISTFIYVWSSVTFICLYILYNNTFVKLYFQPQYIMYISVPFCIRRRMYNTYFQGTQEHYVYTFHICTRGYQESTFEQWVWLSRKSLHGHWWLDRCKCWCHLGQLWLGPGYNGHLPRTLSALRATPPPALPHTATLPQGQDILSR